MKVARIHRHGGPEVLVFDEAPDPDINCKVIMLSVL
jgi:NADPH:quinone reductase-like Zn-dependent oxidoreductase